MKGKSNKLTILDLIKVVVGSGIYLWLGAYMHWELKGLKKFILLIVIMIVVSYLIDFIYKLVKKS